jgi:lathosterol oxidase
MPTEPVAVVAVVTAFFVGCTALGLAIGYALERLSPKRIWSVPLDPGQTRHELIGNAVFLVVAIAACSAASFVVDFGDGDGERPIEVAATFFGFFFAFQLWFYVMHRAVHTKPLVRFHRWHHVSRVTTPLSGQSVSIVEALLWMVGYAGIPLALSTLHPVSFAGVVGYLAFNVVGNIVGHANVELTPPSRTLWRRSTVATVFTYHALHHARLPGHYGYASTWADRLLGTEWHDWPELHARVWREDPLRSLKEHGAERA